MRRGTLRRRLKHPDLSITWTACRVGRDRRYTDHDFIQTFHRETALPPAGVLQRSADAVGLRGLLAHAIILGGTGTDAKALDSLIVSG